MSGDHDALPAGLADRVKALALGLGFDLVGIADAVPGPETRFLREWLARGYAGEMDYLERRVEERVDPRKLLPGARSVVALGFVYDPGDRPPLPPSALAIARYAGGADYHDVLGERVRALESGLEALAACPVRSRGYVDTGPVQERVFAAYAGLGWIGKNTCLIHPRLGSYLFLAVVLTDLALPADVREPDHLHEGCALFDHAVLIGGHLHDAPFDLGCQPDMARRSQHRRELSAQRGGLCSDVRFE